MEARWQYTLLTWLCIFAIAGFYTWIALAPFGDTAAPFVGGVLLCLALILLKLGASNPLDHWEAASEPDQASRIVSMILVAMAVQFVAGAALASVGGMGPMASEALYLTTWIGVPLAFLAFGGVRWPRRRSKPRTRELLVVAGLSVAAAGGLCYLQTGNLDAPERVPTINEYLVGGGSVLLGAAIEESVYRILLLTALVKASGSRFQALTLSSVVFALAHVPPAFSTPVGLQDWGMLQFYATQFLPELVWLIGMGFVFGALWLRTGSILLIVAFHSLLNLAPVLVAGLDGL